MGKYIWLEGNTINIQVNPIYVYDAEIHSLGEPTDQPDPVGTGTMWSWINHLREKTWWNEYLETKFIELAKTISYGRK